MKKTFFCTLFAMTALLVFQNTTVEAGHHRSTRVSVNVGGCYDCGDNYVVRRYARPVAPVVYRTVPGYYSPVYVAPVPAYYAAPAYVEEVYVAPRPRPCPFSFGGLSLSWNFFR